MKQSATTHIEISKIVNIAMTKLNPISLDLQLFISCTTLYCEYLGVVGVTVNISLELDLIPSITFNIEMTVKFTVVLQCSALKFPWTFDSLASDVFSSMVTSISAPTQIVLVIFKLSLSKIKLNFGGVSENI